MELPTLTTVVDLSKYRTFNRCNLLVLRRAKGASVETPYLLHELCGKVAAYHSGGQNFCGVHQQSMSTHAGDGKIFKITSDIVVCCPKFGMALA